jgi:hypothetical protein
MGQGVFGHARRASSGQLVRRWQKAGFCHSAQSFEFCTFETSAVIGSSYGTEDLDLPQMGYLRVFTEKGNLL